MMGLYNKNLKLKTSPVYFLTSLFPWQVTFVWYGFSRTSIYKWKKHCLLGTTQRARSVHTNLGNESEAMTEESIWAHFCIMHPLTRYLRITITHQSHFRVTLDRRAAPRKCTDHICPCIHNHTIFTNISSVVICTLDFLFQGYPKLLLLRVNKKLTSLYSTCSQSLPVVFGQYLTKLKKKIKIKYWEHIKH